MRKITLILFLFVGNMIFIISQTLDSKWALDLHVGKNEYSGELENQFLKFKQSPNPFFGVGLNRYLSQSFDLSILGTFGVWAGSNQVIASFTGKLFDGSLLLNYKFSNDYILDSKSKLSPFITTGIGLAHFSDLTSNIVNASKGSNVIIPLGLGLKYSFSESFALQYKLLHNFNFSEVRDGVSQNNKNDNFLKHALSVVITFGGGSKADSDHDGVIDKYDRCPDTPENVSVDTNGCPLDSDSDAVPDCKDDCPNTPVGVAVDAKGCPFDSDGDGVSDYYDRCPDTQYNVVVDSKGCPIEVDSDGDGVPDVRDKCRNTPKGTRVDKLGCPIIEPTTADSSAKTAATIDNILFQTGRAEISKQNKLLDSLVILLKENKKYSIQINGHADSTGGKNFNQTLSEKRAAVVKQYLIRNNINKQRLIVKAFGDNNPCADNKTEVGRSLNRRVDFVVIK